MRRKTPIEIHPELPQILKLADKDIKRVYVQAHLTATACPIPDCYKK